MWLARMLYQAGGHGYLSGDRDGDILRYRRRDHAAARAAERARGSNRGVSGIGFAAAPDGAASGRVMTRVTVLVVLLLVHAAQPTSPPAPIIVQGAMTIEVQQL